MAQRFAYPVKRSPRNDPQQYRVYRMENEAIGARSYMKMTKAAIAALARSVCRNYGVPQVKLVWKDLGKWAAQWVEGANTIELNVKKGTSQDILTITHELAHHIHHHLAAGADKMHEDHGAEFMACHMSILDTCRVVPVVGMRAICEQYGIRFHDPGTSSSLKRLARICRKPPK